MASPEVRYHRFFAAVLAAVLPVAAADLDARIHRVEQGLRPAVAITGQLQPRWPIADRLKVYKVPGVSVAVIANGAVEWARGYGVVAEGGRPVDSETLFQAASISKPVAAAVALRLVDEGKLSLDEDVNGRLRSWKVPENDFTKTEKVTLRRLLNHSAGLTVHGFGGYAANRPAPTLVELLDGKPPANSAPIRVDIVPGTQSRYSGGGYEVMQQLLTDVTGTAFPDLAQELVLRPLAMTRSGYVQPLPQNLAANAAAAHRGNGAMVQGRWHTYPEMAAAGLWTTPSDLARFAIELQKGTRLLKPATRSAMLTPLLGSYGLGLALGETGGHKSFSHGGANEGYRSILFAYLDTGMGAVIMTNGDRGAALANEILRSIAAEYEWADYKTKERTIARVEPKVLQSYAGRYALAPGFDVVVSFENGKLFAAAQGNKVEIFPESPASFFALTDDVPPIRFARAADGAIEMSVHGRTARREPR